MMIPSHQREVILFLYESEGWVDVYQLHQEKLLSTGQIASVLLDLRESKYCVIRGLSAKLTEAGRNWVVSNRMELFLKVSRDWAQPLPKNDKSVLPNEPYLPNLGQIDRNFYKKLA
jgi:hypothetical protein